MAAPTKTWKLFMRARKCGLFNNNGVLRHLCNSAPRHADQPGGKWQLVSAVCLERPAVLTSECNAMEQEYGDMLKATEFEQSLLSDHELRHKEDVLLAERRKSDDYEDTEAEASRLTALESEDGWEAELAAFTPASRTTAADESGDRTTHERLLDRKLTLLVRQTLGSQTHWVLPQGPRQEDETMRQTAERVLAEKCGSDVKARFLGNAPVGFYKYKFSAAGKDDTVGAKVFFFKALLEDGNVTPAAEDVGDVAWVTRDQLGDMLLPGYRQRVNRFIMDL